MIKTDTGYMGIVHRTYNVGDKIYVLMGSDLPILLRPLGGTFFAFWGVAYVHRIMDGEILDIAMGGERDLSRVNKLGEGPWEYGTEVLVLA
jgi:hypothetical protein